MMRLLLINTCGVEGSVALADTALETPVVAEEVLPGRSSSERLVPVVRQMMEARGWLLKELAGVVVVVGPGSFTGVRVGISAAKGLSEAAGIPLLGVSRLALLAAVRGVDAGTVHAVLDAGRGEFYYGEYVGRRLAGETLLTRDGLLAAVGGGTIVTCDAKVVEALVAEGVQLVPEPTAADVLPLALERLERGDVDDAAVLDANYLRRTDYELLAKLTADHASK
jgi:tRNA threonylcarbamoyladenosine biosynthesis protein TsaB